MLAPVNSENPLNLPAKTMRLKFTAGFTPESSAEEFFSLVDPAENIWDYSDPSDIWSLQTRLYSYRNYLVSVSGANLSGVQSVGNSATGLFDNFTSLEFVDYIYMPDATDARYMFANCTSLKSVTITNAVSLGKAASMFRADQVLERAVLPASMPVLADVSNMFYNCWALAEAPYFTSPLTNMRLMFWNCGGITSIPLYVTEFVTDMYRAFGYCTNVRSGALALYQQASSQATPPSNHSDAFLGCGMDDPEGAAELAQIPASWGGTGE